MNSLTRARSWKVIVRRKVIRGDMEGRTAKEVLPTRPRVTELSAAWLMRKPSLGATR